ncbi:F-box only protein 42 [Eufriesea mexicana]|nr:F-box only protein 42 [Eufriesea mexicana]
MECNIDDLPDVVLEYILSLIPPYKNLQECKLVSKRWFRATKNVIQHNKAHFHKSVAYGSLLWSPWPPEHGTPTIAKRHSHSACTYENSMYVFGGCTARYTTFNDLWRLDLDTRKWIRLITMGTYPSPRGCATMLYYKKSFILFGGWSHPELCSVYQQLKFYNELHVYSIESNRWIVINTLETPPPTSAHSASIHKNYMIVFGGICNGYRSNDVWCLNLDSYSWHKQATSNLKPQPRYGQCQIELGDKHLLVLGGCTGPNDVMNDAWLLKMEGTAWTWKKVNMHNTEWAPTRIWGHQACKVGNYVVVLSISKCQNKPNDMSISFKKVTCQTAPSARTSNASSSLHGRDVNINGRHGSFSGISIQNPRPSHHPPNIKKNFTLCYDNMLSMTAFRNEPVRYNSHRQNQLECFHRVAERVRYEKMQSKSAKKARNTLSIFVLDITNVLCDECSASWIPLQRNGQSGPNERVLYSLVAGRGELIVFGGIGKEQASSYPEMYEPKVYNDLHFINPPRYVI